MSVLGNSYGSPSDVAAEVPRYTDTTSRVFDSDTRPTLKQVEGYINRISGVLNLYIAKAGFSVPIKQADAKLACAQIVIESVIDMCHAANSAGRFYSDKYLSGKSPTRISRMLSGEMADWVEANAAGFEQIGATRNTSNAEQIGFREYDEAGDSVTPIFQRKGFGNDFIEWDS